MQTIFGALSAYLLIGFFFAAVYMTVAKLGTSQFFAGGQPATAASIQYFQLHHLVHDGLRGLHSGG